MAETKGEKGRRLLRQMCADVVKLRRIDQHNERLELERERNVLRRERLALERARFELASRPEPEPWWQGMSRKERIAWSRLPANLKRIEAPLTEEERAEWDETREYLKEREGDRSRDWTRDERIAWGRLPENYQGIYSAGLTPEEKERHRRRILGCETEEDKVYFAKIQAQATQAQAAHVQQNKPDESESGEEEEDEDAEEGMEEDAVAGLDEAGVDDPGYNEKPDAA